jgi:hypothetical protein
VNTGELLGATPSWPRYRAVLGGSRSTRASDSTTVLVDSSKAVLEDVLEATAGIRTATVHDVK